MMSKKGELAAELNKNGYNCSTTVFGAFCEDYGISSELKKLAGALGGGCCRQGDVCGAVSGAALVIGLKHGQNVNGDTAAKANCYAFADEFIKEFKKASPKGDTLICREILGFDLATPEGRQKMKEANLEELPCRSLMVCAAETLEKLGY